ncbi:conserved hypothetical protein [Amphritea japonica ATCC BAA-1530]|uniref:Lipoprotein n=2 Tax=Amphritea TaxID=515417 RepID=A0A7R6P4V3_9GAMM|nr:conserved hypothetical protein [Amphritea japonica ATCC BAA-1530]
MYIDKFKIYTLVVLVVFLTACASGSSIVTGKVRAPIDFNQVKLYLDAPKNYESVGIVKASSDAGWTEQRSQDYAIQELKKQAAKLGANGVLLSTTGENASAIVWTYSNGVTYVIPVSEQTVTGRAIYVSE